jgi:hypothetical protein
MAFKTFTAGSVLTASGVNTYLAKQAVIVCTSGTRPSSPVQGMVIFETDTNKVLAWTSTLWQEMTSCYSATGGAATMSTSYQDVASAVLSLPAGKWVIQGKVGWDTSTAAVQRYWARIYNATGAVELEASFVYCATNAGMLIPLFSTLSLAAPATIKLQVKVDAVQGAQGLQGSKLWATPATALL